MVSIVSLLMFNESSINFSDPHPSFATKFRTFLLISWVLVEIGLSLRWRNAVECHSELAEALGNNALPYCTVARWVGKFQQGRMLTTGEQLGAANADAAGIQRLPASLW
ncbi:HTH_48 domain-containing protein [Trichonephila clavipes]|nr:HTH_48 domain-containing protein [Trichonephila clavipes]